jgi:hypothetical protein
MLGFLLFILLFVLVIVLMIISTVLNFVKSIFGFGKKQFTPPNHSESTDNYSGFKAPRPKIFDTKEGEYVEYEEVD